MVATIPLNPYAQTGGNAGLFNATSTGLRQGTAYPDPSTRYRLRTGVLSANETLPMWGGVGVYAFVPGATATEVDSPGSPSYSLGPIVGRATTLASTYALAGFSVFDQAYGMVTSPQSPVPLIGSYGQVAWYPLGSLARIAVACDPILADLRGANISGAAVAWDFTNQMLIPELAGITITTGSTYNNTTGVITLILPTTGFDPGDSATLASLTGTGAYASLDGTWTVLTVTGTTGATLQGPVGVGASTITGGTLTIGGAASQKLSVTVLDVQTTNCETVEYNATTVTAAWDYNGACAVIQI
jgi:hypothetical protein